MKWKVKIDPRAKLQIKEHFAYYELQQAGLGQRFIAAVLEHADVLERIPFTQIRYDKVRCMSIKGFPYMIHFIVNEEERIVTVYALIHTSRNPESNWGSDDWHVSEPVYYYGPVSV